jgi:hypothetical protein
MPHKPDFNNFRINDGPNVGVGCVLFRYCSGCHGRNTFGYPSLAVSCAMLYMQLFPSAHFSVI